MIKILKLSSALLVIDLFLSAAALAQTLRADHASHGPLRGRPRVSNGTLVAEDGSTLRAISSHTINASQFSQYYGDVNWWKNLHDIGHFNAVRAFAFLGNWFRTGNLMDIPTMERILDTFVSNAAQTGMYVIIDEHSGDNPTDVSKNTTFWRAISPRYANNTNVVYEVKNEPDFRRLHDLSDFENSQFQMIRSLAPKTHIIAWSFVSLISVDDDFGLMKMLAAANKIEYSNASVGFHPYLALGQEARLTNLTSQMQAAGYPVIMTEYSDDRTPPLSYLLGLEAKGISWAFLDGTGFTAKDTGVTYGCCSRGNPISITWPKD